MIQSNKQVKIENKSSYHEKKYEKLAKSKEKCPIRVKNSIANDGKEKFTLSLNPSANENSSEKKYENMFQGIFGVIDDKIIEEILTRSAAAMPVASGRENNFNVILQSLHDMQPHDAYEARLCAQATVLYSQAMRYIERLNETLCKDELFFAQDHWHSLFVKTASKLMNLHNKTIDTIIRYRQKGEQKIIVQHVHVSDGGRAIVGNVIGKGGRDNHKNQGSTPC